MLLLPLRSPNKTALGMRHWWLVARVCLHELCALPAPLRTKLSHTSHLQAPLWLAVGRLIICPLLACRATVPRGGYRSAMNLGDCTRG